MPALSAPSANSLTFSPASGLVAVALLISVRMAFPRRNYFRRRPKIPSPEVRLRPQLFRVSPVDKNGGAGGRVSTVYIPPPVPDHVAPRQRQFMLRRRVQQQPGLRLAAPARILVVVIAHVKNFQPQFVPQPRMHRFDRH